MGKKRSIVQHSNKIGYWVGRGDCKKFIPLTNFGVKILKFVTAPTESKSYTGFVVEVTQVLRCNTLTGTCFLPWYEVNTGTQLKRVLGEALPHAALVCNLEQSDVQSLMFHLWNDIYGTDDVENDDSDMIKSYKPVVCMGKQPNSDVYVIGPELMFTSDGTRIQPENQDYLWVPRVLEKLKVASIIYPITELPNVNEPLRQLMRGLVRVTGNNSPSAVFILGAAVMSLFHESMIKICGTAAIHIAYGDVGRGKTNAVKLALAASCNLQKGLQTYLTESVARRHLGGALPFGYDDPSNISILKQMLINAFGGAEMSTQLSNFSARCTPIITVNTFVVDELTLAESRYLSRTVLVPFVYDAPDVEIGILSQIIDDAPAAFPVLLSIGRMLEEMDNGELEMMQEKVSTAISEKMDSRLCTQYCMSITCAQKLVTVASASLTPDDIWDHFVTVMIPEIRDRQVQKQSKQEPMRRIGEMVNSFGQSATISEVLQVVNPNIKYKLLQKNHSESFNEDTTPDDQTRTVVVGIAIILKEFLAALDRHNIPHPTEKSLRQTIRKVPNCLSNAKQYFLQSQSDKNTIDRQDNQSTRCKTCICIPKDAIPSTFFDYLKKDEGRVDGSALCSEDQEDNGDNLDDADFQLDDSGFVSPLATVDDQEVASISITPMITINSSPSPRRHPKRVAARLSASTCRKVCTPLSLRKRLWYTTPRRLQADRIAIGLCSSAKRMLCFSPKKLAKTSPQTYSTHVSRRLTPKKNSFDCLSSPRSSSSLPCVDVTPAENSTEGSSTQLSNIPQLNVSISNYEAADFSKIVKSRQTADKKRSKRNTISKANKNVDVCQRCKKKYRQNQAKKWVGCDFCWRWWHFKCVGLKRQPPQREEFICPICK